MDQQKCPLTECLVRIAPDIERRNNLAAVWFAACQNWIAGGDRFPVGAYFAVGSRTLAVVLIVFSFHVRMIDYQYFHSSPAPDVRH
jgi:hypothetical protein